MPKAGTLYFTMIVTLLRPISAIIYFTLDERPSLFPDGSPKTGPSVPLNHGVRPSGGRLNPDLQAELDQATVPLKVDPVGVGRDRVQEVLMRGDLLPY